MSNAIHELPVANRSEIAERIIRAAQAMGIPPVSACSEADANYLPANPAVRAGRLDTATLEPWLVERAAPLAPIAKEA